MRKFKEIERLRGVAIILAVFNHNPLHEFFPLFCGVVGVHLFFVISGFVITRSLVRLLPQSEQSPVPALKTFFAQRFFRIVPMLTVSVTTVLLASIFYNTSHIWSAPMLVVKQIGLVFTLLFNHNMVGLGADLLYCWSLNVEEHFYIVLPLLLVAVTAPRARIAAAALVVVLTALVFRPFAAPATHDAIRIWSFHFSTLPRIDTLMAGVLLALVAQARLMGRPRSTIGFRVAGQTAAWAGLATLIFVHRYFLVSQQITWTIVLVASAGLVWLASLNRGLILGIPHVAGFFEYLGSRSYAIYLMHMPAWGLIAEFMSRHPAIRTAENLPKLAAYFVVLTLLTSELAHQLVEKPFIRIGRKFGNHTLTPRQITPMQRAA